MSATRTAGSTGWDLMRDILPVAGIGIALYFVYTWLTSSGIKIGQGTGLETSFTNAGTAGSGQSTGQSAIAPVIALLTGQASTGTPTAESNSKGTVNNVANYLSSGQWQELLTGQQMQQNQSVLLQQGTSFAFPITAAANPSGLGVALRGAFSQGYTFIASDNQPYTAYQNTATKQLTVLGSGTVTRDTAVTANVETVGILFGGGGKNSQGGVTDAATANAWLTRYGPGVKW